MEGALCRIARLVELALIYERPWDQNNLLSGLVRSPNFRRRIINEVETWSSVVVD